MTVATSKSTDTIALLDIGPKNTTLLIICVLTPRRRVSSDKNNFLRIYVRVATTEPNHLLLR